MDEIELFLRENVTKPERIVGELVSLYTYTINGENPPSLCADDSNDIIRISKAVTNPEHIMGELVRLYTYTINGENPPRLCSDIQSQIDLSVEVQPALQPALQPLEKTPTPKLVITVDETGTAPLNIICDVVKLDNNLRYDNIEEITLVEFNTDESSKEVVAWNNNVGEQLIDNRKFTFTRDNDTVFLQCKVKEYNKTYSTTSEKVKVEPSVVPQSPLEPPQSSLVNNSLSDTSLKTLSCIVDEAEVLSVNSPTNNTYMFNVPSDTHHIKIKATPNVTDATLTLMKSDTVIEFSKNSNGVFSDNIELNENPGSTTDITLTVIAKNATTKKNYTVRVIKNSLEASLIGESIEVQPVSQALEKAPTPVLRLVYGNKIKSGQICCLCTNTPAIEEITIVELSDTGDKEHTSVINKDETLVTREGLLRYDITPQTWTTYLQCKIKVSDKEYSNLSDRCKFINLKETYWQLEHNQNYYRFTDTSIMNVGIGAKSGTVYGHYRHGMETDANGGRVTCTQKIGNMKKRLRATLNVGGTELHWDGDDDYWIRVNEINVPKPPLNSSNSSEVKTETLLKVEEPAPEPPQTDISILNITGVNDSVIIFQIQQHAPHNGILFNQIQTTDFSHIISYEISHKYNNSYNNSYNDTIIENTFKKDTDEVYKMHFQLPFVGRKILTSDSKNGNKLFYDDKIRIKIVCGPYEVSSNWLIITEETVKSYLHKSHQKAAPQVAQLQPAPASTAIPNSPVLTGQTNSDRSKLCWDKRNTLEIEEKKQINGESHNVTSTRLNYIKCLDDIAKAQKEAAAKAQKVA